jgi:hypothetical protein
MRSAIARGVSRALLGGVVAAIALACSSPPPPPSQTTIAPPDALPPSGRPDARPPGPLPAPPTGSPLPDYAAPKGWVADPESIDQTDVIPYRMLTREDFRGTEPPPWIQGVRGRVGAATCGHILTTPDTVVNIEPLAAGGYEARVGRLHFVAQMDRNCSWWNPQNPGFPNEYILQHEQIHFALFELEARKLDASARDLSLQIRGVGPTSEAANSDAQTELYRVLEARVGRILDRSREFDQDTSLGYDPDAQERWWQRVSAELRE